MTSRPHYPDSTGSHWDAAASRGPAAERPAFLNRTEPISQQHREAANGDASLDDLMGGGGTSRLPSQQPGENVTPPGAHQVPGQPGPQWPVEVPAAPASHTTPAEPPRGDPELAAAAGMEAVLPEPATPGHTGPGVQVAGEPPRMPPAQAPPSPPPHAQAPSPPPPAQAPPSPPPPAQAPSPPPHTPPPPNTSTGMDGHGLHEPTQMHNPVSPQTNRGRTYPAQGSEGTYQRRRPALGMAVIAGTLLAAGLTLYMLARTLVAGDFGSSALLSGGFALIGLPLTAAGIYPLLGAGSAPDERVGALLRAPYVYLFTGVALLIAAGLAA